MDLFLDRVYLKGLGVVVDTRELTANHSSSSYSTVNSNPLFFFFLDKLTCLMQLFVAFIVRKLQFEVGSDVRWQFTLGL